MKTAAVAFLFVLLNAVSGAEVPGLFSEKAFTAKDLAEAVNHFIALGEEGAVKELSALTSDPGFKKDADARCFEMPERVGWVCRILFQPKGDKPLRGPMYGGHSLPQLTMPAKSWPLYPVAASGDSFFVLSEGYRLAGRAEDPLKYLAYCRAQGLFRKKAVPVPTCEQAQKDAALLRASAGWKAIKWVDSGPGSSYRMNEGWVWSEIQKQADGIK